MKLVIGLALAAGIGCAHPQPAPTTPATPAGPAAAAPGGKAAAPAGAAAEAPSGDDAAPGGAGGPGSPGGKIDRSGTVQQQLARLQDAYDRNAEALEFLNRVYAQQKAQQAEREREPDPDAMFAVEIGPDVKLGMVDGSRDAPVTIVEAWDFG